MQDTTATEKSVVVHSKSDRLAVVVTGCDVNKVIGTVKLPSGTEQSQAKAIFELLELSKVRESVIGMCFDTTIFNTGLERGARVFRELPQNMPASLCPLSPHS